MTEDQPEDHVDGVDTNPNKKRGKKKRKNFLSNAKKYAKKGQLGRGTKIPEELYQYFVGILDAMKKGIEDEEERQSLVTNVLDRTKGEELNIAGNQLGCRVIELLLPYSSAEDLERFMEVFYPEIRPLCSDNFTSHVVEQLLKTSCERATEHLRELPTEDAPKKKKKKKEAKYTDEHIKTCHNFTIKLCKYVLNNLEDFVWDQYANHILRSALKCLSGIELLPGEKPKINMFVIQTKQNKGIPPHEKLQYKPVPEEFLELVKEFANRLSSWPQFKDLPYKNITSGLLQVLLYALKNADKSLAKDIIRKLLDESFAPEDWVEEEGTDEKKEDKVDVDDTPEGGKEDVDMVPEDQKVNNRGLPPVFTSEPAVRLLEASLFVANKKTYTQLYARCFINRLAALAARPALNFTVQRLLDNCRVKEELEPMFSELSGRFAALLASNTGVLVALGKACLRVRAKQAQFVTALESALGCTGAPQHLAVCCLRLTSLDRVDLTQLEREYFIHVHGAVLLQTMLDFQRPAKPVSSLLELSPAALLVVFSDAKGCHVADKLFTAPGVGVKARDKMQWKLKGTYQQLALSQYGSRAFEKIFDAVSAEQKIKIMAEISEKSNLLNGTMYGKLIATKFKVELFKTSPEQWKNAMSNETKYEGVFKDV